MTELYSYLDREPPSTTLTISLARPRFDAGRGGWFAFAPTYHDAGEDCLAGAWVGPLPSEAIAVQIADETNATLISVLRKMRERMSPC